jgi:hypothetical protein
VARGDDIEEGLITFAVRLSRVGDALSGKPADRHIRGQLLRCGPSVLSYYQHQHSNCPPGDTQLTIQQFNKSTINYCFSASTAKKHAHCQWSIARSLVIGRWSLVVRRSSFVVRRWSFVVRRWSMLF